MCSGLSVRRSLAMCATVAVLLAGSSATAIDTHTPSVYQHNQTDLEFLVAVPRPAKS
jgi:hypothetical protein